MIGTHFRATHYMIFSISAFALFILISYYATNNSLQTQMPMKGVKLHHTPWIEVKRGQTELKSANLGERAWHCYIVCKFLYRKSLSEVNSSQLHNDADSISNIIFKGVVSPAGTVNGTYFQYLVNQSQVEMGVPRGS